MWPCHSSLLKIVLLLWKRVWSKSSSSIFLSIHSEHTYEIQQTCHLTTEKVKLLKICPKPTLASFHCLTFYCKLNSVIGLWNKTYCYFSFIWDSLVGNHSLSYVSPTITKQKVSCSCFSVCNEWECSALYGQLKSLQVLGVNVFFAQSRTWRYFNIWASRIIM